MKVVSLTAVAEVAVDGARVLKFPVYVQAAGPSGPFYARGALDAWSKPAATLELAIAGEATIVMGLGELGALAINHEGEPPPCPTVEAPTVATSPMPGATSSTFSSCGPSTRPIDPVLAPA